MKNSHFHFFLFVLTVGFGLLGYYSYRTIDYTFTDTVPVEPEVVEPYDSVTTIPSNDETLVTEPIEVKPTEEVAVKVLKGIYKEIADELQNDLIKKDIRMNIGSNGTRVGWVQKFLNIYLNKNETVDNKYGAGTKRNVEAFQKETGDEVDGLADPGTYQKMIDWLKENKAE